MKCVSSGAKGIANFSENIKSDYLPPTSSIQYEGIFYDYFFETVDEQEKLFKANFNYAETKDPINNEKEYYISFGMTGKTDGKGFYKHGGRPYLNLVIVLDISGSMSSPFRYREPNAPSKLEVAKESILTLLNHLNENDVFSLICFDDHAYVTHAPQLWKDTDQTLLKNEILAIGTKGGTSLTAGINSATERIKEMQAKFPSRPTHAVHKHVENRIMFLTDMCPTTDDSDGKHLFGLTEKNSKEKVFTTFVGIGLDFRSDIAAKIGHITGCNYLSVKSAKEFKKMMHEDFDYLVTPNVFNVSIEIDPESEKEWNPVYVFGSPGNEHPKKGRLTFIDSCFPSQKEDENATKGGMIVVKMNKLTDNPTTSIKFRITYEDTYGTKYEDHDTLTISAHEDDFYETLSIRKAILLVRYVKFFKNFLSDAGTSQPSMNDKVGIVIPSDLEDSRRGHSKSIAPEYDALFKKFSEHFTKEMDAIGDSSLEKELQNLQACMNKGKK